MKMSDNFNGISRESFTAMETDSKLNVLFDLSVSMHKRLGVLERAKWWNKFLSIMCGFGAGAAVVISKIFYTGNIQP